MWRWRTFVVSGVGRTSSGINVDGRAIAHHCINLFNLPITDRNTSGGPVLLIRWIDPPPRATVDKDITPWRLALSCRKSAVGRIRFGYEMPIER
jgi:hypothetical protein